MPYRVGKEKYEIIFYRSDQISRSVVSDSLQPHESQHARPPCPSPTPEFTQTHVHRVSDAIQPSHPLSSPSPLPPIPPSIRIFSNESTFRMTWPNYWSFSFSIIPSKEIPGLNKYPKLCLTAISSYYHTHRSVDQLESSVSGFRSLG